MRWFHCTHILNYIPFSATFFTDPPLTVRRSRLPGSYAHFWWLYLCSQLQQHHAELLASKSKCFCSGTNFVSRAFWVSFVRAHQLCDPSRRCSPHNPWPTRIWKRLLETRIESHVALEVDTVVYKSGIAIVLFQEHTVDSWAIYLKSFEELNFVVWDEFTKTAKIMRLKNLALYSRSIF